MRSTKGPGSHFLGCARTQGNFETAFYRSTIADNNSFEQLEAEGRHPARQQALQEDAGHEAPALDPAIDEALQEFMAKKKAAVPDSNV